MSSLVVNFVLPRLGGLFVAVFVALLGVRWLLMGQRRGWLLVAAAAVRLIGSIGSSVYAAAAWYGLGAGLVAAIGVASVEGVLGALSWTLLLTGLLLPGARADLDVALD